MSPAAPTRRSPVLVYVDEAVPTFSVQLYWQAADVGGTGELTFVGDSLAVAEFLLGAAGRFALEHTEPEPDEQLVRRRP